MKIKKNILVALSSISITMPIIAISCSVKEKQDSDKNIVSENSLPTINSIDRGLIGEELKARVAEVIQESTFSLTDKAKKEYESLSKIERDEYILKLWEKIQNDWFNDNRDHLERPAFDAYTVNKDGFSEYLNIHIPNLFYFENNHEFHCYFGYNAETRNLFYYFKIKCLDGKQTEGDKFVYLDLPGSDSND
ncbi:hypothetical protein AB5V95_00690 [Metamycoplasma spumans]|uniref:hypothetical protein n=1 Tax=Metamycoplasma spumans TaxID=92406 RepID=UPI0034DD7E41